MWIVKLPALLISFAAVLLAVRRVLVEHCDESRLSIALASTLAVGGTLPYVIGRVIGRLDAGVWAAGAVSALIVLVLPRRDRHPPPLERQPLHRFALGILVLLSSMAMTTTWFGYQFDEAQGHIPLSKMLARNSLLLQHPFFPGDPFRYHFAFNVLVAELMQAGLPVLRAIDVVVTACFIAFIWLSIDIGQQLAGRLGASLGSFLIPMATGTFFFVTFASLDFGFLSFKGLPVPANWADNWSDSVPPVISNFFQHPQGLGMPISLAVLMMTGREVEDEGLSRRRFSFGCLLLGLCSLAQFVYFLILGLALGVSSATVALRRRDLRYLAFRTLTLLGALGIAFVLGGFLTPTEANGTSLIRWGVSYFDDGPLMKVLRHFVVFGFPLFLLPLSASRLSKNHFVLRVTLLVGALVAFVIPNIAIYERSWDIVKFYGVGELLANVLLVDVAAEFLARRSGKSFKIWLIASILVLTNSSWIWFLRHSFLDGRVAGIPPAFLPPHMLVGEAILERLGDSLGPYDRVMATNQEDGAGGGILTPGVARSDMSFLVDLRRAQRYADALDRARRHLARGDLDLLEVKFISLGPDDVASLAPDGIAATKDTTRLRDLGEVSTPEGSRHLWEVVRP